MNKITPTIIIWLLTFTSIPAQVEVTAQLANHPRTIPLIGFNTNAIHDIATWTVPAFVDSTAYLNPSILRYPGGTLVSYWDWKTGWIKTGITVIPAYQNIQPQILVRADEFKIGLDAANSEALMVMNILNSNITYELDGLKHGDSLGINIKYVEIGNEHNLNQDMIPPGTYASASKIWCDSIKSVFPNSKICLVGGNPPGNPHWNDSIFAHSPDFDALALHVYLGADNTDSVFNVARAMQVPFRDLETRISQGGFNNIPDSIEIWATEYNLWEGGYGAKPVIAKTWTQALYVTAMNHILLKNPNIKMLVNNNLTNQDIFAAIDPFTLKILANGVAMKLLSDVIKGLTSADEILFTPNLTTNYSGTIVPKIIGWKFSGSNQENGLIANISKDTLKVSLTSVFNNSMNYFEYSADTAFIVNGYSSLNLESGNSTNTLILTPYSITQIYSTINTTNLDEISGSNLPKNILLFPNYPNPFNPSTSIKYFIPNNLFVNIGVFDILGREIRILLNREETSGYHSLSWDGKDSNGRGVSSGIYFCVLRSKDIFLTGKMLYLK